MTGILRNIPLPRAFFLTAAGYFLFASLGQFLSFQPSAFATFWPPSGLMLAILMLNPYGRWPFLLLAAVTGNIAFDLFNQRMFFTSVLFSLGNGMEYSCGAFLMRRFFGETIDFISIRWLTAFILLAGLLSPVSSATVGSLVVTKMLGGTPALSTFVTWWCGDIFGVLLFSPPILLFAPRRKTRIALSFLRYLEAILFTAAVFLSTWLIFCVPFRLPVLQIPLIIVLIIIAAFRFNLPFTTFLMLSSALMTTYGTSRGMGRFALNFSTLSSQSLALQAHLLLLFLVSILVPAAIELRRRSEEQLRQSEADLKKSRQVARIGAWKWYIPENRVEWSDEVFDIWGIEKTDATGQLTHILRQAVHPEDRDIFKTTLRSAIRHGDTKAVEYRIQRPDGNVRWIFAQSGEILRDSTGKPVFLSGIIQDITERKFVEEALRLSESSYRSLVENGPDAILRLSTDGSPLYMSKNLDRIIPEPENFNQLWENGIQRVLETGKVFETELDAKTPNGIKFLHLRFCPEAGSDGRITAILCIVQDMSELKKLQQEMDKNRKLDSLGVLAGGIAHEFNNLLAGMFGNIELAQDSISRGLPDQAIEELTEALSIYQRTKRLTGKLLTFSKGGAPMRQSINLHLLMEKIVSSIIQGSGVTVQYDIAPDLWPCRCDEQQIGQVIENLAMNACDAMPSGGEMSISAKNIYSAPGKPAQGPGRFVRISFQDRGHGIGRDILPRIFDPFFTTRESRHGLGLATAHSIVKQHGGWIDVESEPGKGAVFHIFLPTSMKNLSIAETQQKVTFLPQTGKVLIMDDEDYGSVK